MAFLSSLLSVIKNVRRCCCILGREKEQTNKMQISYGTDMKNNVYSAMINIVQCIKKKKQCQIFLFTLGSIAL